MQPAPLLERLMDVLYFRVSSECQTTENQFEDLLQMAQKDGSGREWLPEASLEKEFF